MDQGHSAGEIATVKIRLKAGSREVEAEGTQEEVDAFLSKWWTAQTSEEDLGRDEETDVREANGTPPAKAVRPRNDATNAPLADDRMAIVKGLVHKLKSGKDVERYKKVLHDRDQLNRVQLIYWVHDDYLTGHEVGHVFKDFGVKMRPSNIRTVLSNNKSLFLKEGRAYKLTAPAREKFEKELLNAPTSAND
jgi:hypothetical protein